MEYIKLLLLTASLTTALSSCGQSERFTLGETYAKEQLKSALLDTRAEQVLVESIVPDKETATKISEAILFKAYGKDNIIAQRPYETYLINNHWIIIGTLPKGSLGGTFLLILNAKDSKVIRLTHGK